MIGVDYILFWQLNPRKLEPFIEGFKQRLKLQQEQMNFTSWLSGLYVTHAIAACFGKNHNYPSEPISFEAADENEKGKQNVQRFEALAINFNQQYKEEQVYDEE